MQTSKNTSPMLGIMLMVAAMGCFALMNAAIRELSFTMQSGQMVFLRNLLAFFMICLLVMPKGIASLRTQRLKSHLWRASVGFSAMEIWFYCISIMPLALATALSFTTPVFATIFAIVFLKEKAGWRRWAAIVASFSGVLLILRPDMGGLPMSASFVLVSSALMAWAGIVVKSLTRTESPATIVFYMGLFMTPLSLPFALAVWQPVTGEQWVLAFVIALFSTAAQLMMSHAYRHADMVVLLPFDFTRLIFTAFLAWAIFGEVMDGRTLAGAAVIAASSVYIAQREAKLGRKSAQQKIAGEP